MIRAYGLLQIFYTMTMAEDKWPHLHQILRTSDNNDTLPTNRPLHVYMFYRNYLNNIRNKLWKNLNLAGWEKWKHFFERDEFHGFVYTERKTPELIALDIIRANVPDPDIEPELYRLVTTFQVHHCDHRCRPQGQTDGPCSKGFPQPLSQTTHCSGNSLRYLYRRTKEEDWIVIPYNPETLLIWRGHINFQYVTSTGFAKYITKYITKPESSELFDIDEQDNMSWHED